MNTANSLLFLLLCVISCKSNDCVIDKGIKKEFYKELNVVKRQYKGQETLVDEYTDAIFYLEFVTSIPTKASYSNTIGYRNGKDYTDDISSWEEWYRKNRCSINRKFIDSVLKHYEYQGQLK